ncbi:MAG: hypothetical protein V3S08_10155, partial [Phycisphaerales bacterium]
MTADSPLPGSETIIGHRRELEDRAGIENPASHRFLRRKESRELDVAEAEVMVVARHERWLVDHRDDRPGDHAGNGVLRRPREIRSVHVSVVVVVNRVFRSGLDFLLLLKH